VPEDESIPEEVESDLAEESEGASGTSGTGLKSKSKATKVGGVRRRKVDTKKK